MTNLAEVETWMKLMHIHGWPLRAVLLNTRAAGETAVQGNRGAA